MAKIKNDSNVVDVAPVVDDVATAPPGIITINSSVLTFDGHTVDTSNLPPASIAYLLQYGFAQCLQDMSLAQIRAASERKGVSLTPGEIVETLNARRAEKVANLLTGQIFARKAGTPKGTTFDKMVNAVAKERLTAIIIKSQRAMPKGDDFALLLNKYLDKYGADVRAEAQRRIDMAIPGDVDIDDLF